MSEQPTDKATEPAAPEVPEPQAADKVAEPATNGTVAPEAQPAEKPEETVTADKPAEQPATETPAATEEPAAQQDNAEESKPAEPAAEQPAYLASNPALVQFFERLPAILSTTGHTEMWGVPLKDSNDIPTVNVMIKFLRANEGNVKLAEEQLTKALEWRKTMDPLSLIDRSYSATKFGGLGYITTYKESKTVATWNIYGGVKDIDNTFGDIDEFLRWRVALMELAVQDLKMAEATSVIDYAGEDPYQMIQVHDYQNVKFFRSNPSLRAATKKTIDAFATAYPELLREKFFVNVPAIMGWMFAAIKVFVSKNTTRKFHPISNGANLAREFPSMSAEFPKTYGGQGPELRENAKTVRLQDDAPAPAETSEPVVAADKPTEEAAKEEPKQEEPVKTEPVVTTDAAPAATEAK